MKCRHCYHELEHVFLDLGHAPPSNAYLSASQLRAPETTFPLRLYVCDKCWLVQTEDYAAADELFSRDYAYFSSTSRSWLQHAARYVEKITEILKLNCDSFVIEVASNDGYLLKNFVAADIPCLGVEPTSSTADAAEKIGVPVLRKFFGEATATELADAGKRADLICGNNVYAHVPDINDFTDGLRIALKQGGTINLEFPASDEPDQAQSIRYGLSRAFFLSLAYRRRSHICKVRTAHFRSGRTADARRKPAHLRMPRKRSAGDTAGCDGYARKRECLWLARSSHLSRVSAQGGQG
ncbi:SAM-dependent methyltransferase [Bradyrhizobium sp. GM7.3]